MIREFKLKRMFFVPVGFLNSVARWCLGIRSSDGSVEITNTADPGSNGSADLRVNIESVSNRIRERFDTMGFSEAERNSVKAIIRGTMDGVSIVNIGEHFGVSESWITQTIEKNIGDSFVEKGTPFVADKYVKVGADGKLVTSDDDDFLTEDDIGVSVCSEGDYEVLLDDCQALADDVDSILADYLTSADIGVSVAAQNHTHSEYAASNHTHSDYAAVNHTHSGYASSSHAHGNITSDGKLNGCTSNDCLVITGAGGVITHSNSSPKASDVASLVSQWITNGRTIGGGSIDHTKITDWASATSGFLDSSDYDALADAIGDLADIVDGCLFPADIGVTVAAQNHTHTTANISDWSTATASFLTDADLAGYALDADLAALEDTVYDLSDVVDGILADYVTSADLGDYITTDEIPANFLTAIASRKSGSFTFLTNIQFDGTNLQKKTRTVTITQGVVTNLGTESAWSTWHTPTVITWS